MASLWNAGDHKAGKRLLDFAVLVAFAISMVAVIGIHMMRGQAIAWLLPAGDRGGLESYPWLLFLLSAGGAVWQIALLVHKPLEMAVQTKMMLALICCSFCVKLAVNVWGVERWGLYAIASGTLISGLFYCLSCFVAGRYKSS
jgi:O-antigen/teichoic acid export membrane protein